jgi:endonuclease/exonuclease/phosphatase family metal-dependent hydrolase
MCFFNWIGGIGNEAGQPVNRVDFARFSPVTLLALVMLAGVILVTGCSTPGKQDGVRLDVMTYNIRIGAGGGAWPSDPSQLDLEPVARLMERHGPDIVGLQEVDQFRVRSALMDQPAMLRDRLKMNVAFAEAYTVKTEAARDEKYGVALLARQPILAHTRYPLFKPDYSQSNPNYPVWFSEQRVLLYAPVLIGGRQVHVFVTHLGLTVDQREKQIREIAEITARYSGPKILMGDFNAEPEEPAMKLLEKEFLDVLSVAGVSREERKSYPGGLNPTAAIDYIFVTPEFRVLGARVIRDATLASDHNPVVAELEFLRR